MRAKGIERLNVLQPDRVASLVVAMSMLAGCNAHGTANARADSAGEFKAEVSGRVEAKAEVEADGNVRLSEGVQLKGDTLDYGPAPIDFEYNKAELKGPDTFKNLNRLLQVLKQHPEVKVHIEGHADSRGDDKYNLELSKLRARAIRKWFIDNNVDPDRLTAEGYGEDRKDRESDGCRDKTGPDAIHAENCKNEWEKSRHADFKVVGGIETLRPNKEQKKEVAEEPHEEPPPKEEKRKRKVWLGLMLAPDYANVSGSDVCTSPGDEWECPSGLAERVDVEGRFRYSTLRLLGILDVVVGGHVTLGLRGGYAFRSGPNAMPIHIEGRLSYWFLDDSFSRLGFRPYGFLTGGMAKVDTMAKTVALPFPGAQEMEIWHQTGQGFFGAGLGTVIAFKENHGPLLEVKLSRSTSPATTVISPGFGWVFGF